MGGWGGGGVGGYLCGEGVSIPLHAMSTHEVDEQNIETFCDSYNLTNFIKQPPCNKNSSHPIWIDLTLSAPIPDEEFTLLCGASIGFMKALKAFTKLFLLYSWLQDIYILAKTYTDYNLS